jgi:hypothetical protein
VVPRQIWRDLPLPAETKAVLNTFTTGPLPSQSIHSGFSQPHRDYNSAVEKMWDSKNFNAQKMTEKQAREFINEVLNSKDKPVKSFLDELAKEQRGMKRKPNWRNAGKISFWTIAMPSVWHLCNWDPANAACCPDEH